MPLCARRQRGVPSDTNRWPNSPQRAMPIRPGCGDSPQGRARRPSRLAPTRCLDSPGAAARRSPRQIQVAALYPPPGRLSHVLAGRRTVCLRHPHRYHVGQVDDHAAVAGLAAISGLGQDQAAPSVQRLSDGLKRLALPAKILRYHGDVFTAHRMKSHDQHDVVRHNRYLPARIQKTARPGAVAREPSPGWVTTDPDTFKCASPAARQSQAQAAGQHHLLAAVPGRAVGLLQPVAPAEPVPR